MDRDALARALRRRDAEHALDFERGRGQMLREQLEERVAESEGWRADEAVLARLEAADVEVLRRMSFPAEPPQEEERADLEEEIVRLEHEIADCRLRQQALERYLGALAESGSGPAATA